MCLYCNKNVHLCCQFCERSKELCEFLLLAPNQNLTHKETQFCLQSKYMTYDEFNLHMVLFLQENLEKLKPTKC